MNLTPLPISSALSTGDFYRLEVALFTKDRMVVPDQSFFSPNYHQIPYEQNLTVVTFYMARSALK